MPIIPVYCLDICLNAFVPTNDAKRTLALTFHPHPPSRSGKGIKINNMKLVFYLKTKNNTSTTLLIPEYEGLVVDGFFCSIMRIAFVPSVCMHGGEGSDTMNVQRTLVSQGHIGRQAGKTSQRT